MDIDKAISKIETHDTSKDLIHIITVTPGHPNLIDQYLQELLDTLKDNDGKFIFVPEGIISKIETIPPSDEYDAAVLHINSGASNDLINAIKSALDKFDRLSDKVVYVPTGAIDKIEIKE